MRGWVALVVTIVATGCQKPASPQGGTGAAAAPRVAAMDARAAAKLAPGEWQIIAVTVPPPGAPGPPETSTDTIWLSVEEGINPPPRLFGACGDGPVHLSGGAVRASLRCQSEGGMNNASVSVSGTYTRTSFQVTVDTRFMGMTIRQDYRARLLRAD